MGKAAKQARNRAIKRKQREDKIKAQVEHAKALLDFIKQNPKTVFEDEILGIVPSSLVKRACEMFIKMAEI